jgi:L-fuculose-phosphate aldolase
VAFTIAGIKLPGCILPETVLTMGDIPLTEYASPTSPENALVIEEHIKVYDAIVLNRHGSITVGCDLISAYNKLEKIEHTAITAIAAKQLGGLNPLPIEEITKLLEMGREQGLLEHQTACNNCNLCDRG